MVYQKQQEEATAIKYKRTPVDEERALHEAYQVMVSQSLLSKGSGVALSRATYKMETRLH